MIKDYIIFTSIVVISGETEKAVGTIKK